MSDLIRAGLQIPLFTYSDAGPADIFDRVAAQAEAAEDSGFDSVWVMDHFWQLPMLGNPDQEMLEAYTTLGALAARTSRVNLGTLVTGVTYRNPTLLAKIVTTLDVISRGRAICGIGAAWFDVEHVGLGFDFPPLKVRFEMLEEALVILRAMFSEENPTFDGTHYRTANAFNSPGPVRSGGPPIMVGGSGERKTLPLGARLGDAINLSAARDELPRKVEIIERSLAEAGKSRDEFNISWLQTLIMGDTTAEADEKLLAMLAARGMDPSVLDDPEIRAMVTGRMTVGDADACVAQLRGDLATGLDGIIVNLPGDDGDPGAVRRAGEVLLAATA
ncbi:MAG: LLM class F420-dependent oxidoreductase [Acidimicrobiales bacterium]